jgi:putative DNA methylase
MIKVPKKLIEVALPLDDINAACAHEKMPGIGPHPRGIHLWWARRPLAAARAVLFAQMVNDPGGERGYYAGKTKAQANLEREKLFDIIRDLVKWENTNNQEVLERAREAIRQSWRETCDLNKGKEGFDPNELPAFHDPFAGGGAIPLEAQRLGLESYASDLNPVAAMINKAMIEIPPKFANKSPIGPLTAEKYQRKLVEDWPGISGLAEDVRRYGYWVHTKAKKLLTPFYPKITVTPDLVKERPDLIPYVGQELTVIAWLWTRTVKSPNPAYSHKHVPLVSSFVLSSKKGKEVYIRPTLVNDDYHFEVGIGKPHDYDHLKNGTKRSGATFNCLFSDSPIDSKYLREQGKSGRIGVRLLATVAIGSRERVYLSPTKEMEEIALGAKPLWSPEVEFFQKALGFRIGNYGYTRWSDLFTNRQLLALSTYSNLIQEVIKVIENDAIRSGMVNDGIGIDSGGKGATAYADAITMYLAFCVDRCADFNNAFTGWRAGNEKIMYLFSRQTISMLWDYGEANIIEKVVGCFPTNLEYQVKCLLKLSAKGVGCSTQTDAASQNISSNKVVSTDPPYYDNIGYSDLSDFFYMWMRKNLRDTFPSLLATITVPKNEELVANPYRHGSKENAEHFFLSGMTKTLSNLAERTQPSFPVTVYYAFKQSETTDDSTSSTGWETFLEAVIRSGFMITGTWPLRSEQTHRVRGLGANALASSVVLVCKKRPLHAESISRRQFQRELREELPEALEEMTGGKMGASPIAPVDLAQAAIGPGIGVFSKYKAVLNQDGADMPVHDALVLINRTITEYLDPDSGSFDNDTLFCSGWFSENGWSTGQFGQANTLAQAKGTTVDGVRDAGVIESGGGKVRLLKWQEYPEDWDPKEDNRTPVWEATHQMIRALSQESATAAGALLARMPERGESIRQLAYHLYTLCERMKWADDARAYNELITAWHDIVGAAHDVGHVGEQTSMEF